MKKRFLFLMCVIFFAIFVMSACEAKPGPVGATGADGPEGKSAYQAYKEKYNYEGTEQEWLQDLINGELSTLPEHLVTFDPNNGELAFTQSIKDGEKAKRPSLPIRDGYTFQGWMYDDGIAEEIWNFGGGSITEDITLIAKWDYATYELPIININTDDAEIDSKENYTDMTFSLENCESEFFDLSGGIRLRGNSTSKYGKKPYRIKFDSKQPLFGLKKAKSWVLLAEYLDPSALHNYTAFSLASQMPGLGFTPTPYKVNVYLNGVYAGLYTLCEQVQENEGRMDIELDEITEDMVDLKDFNFFIAMDWSVTEDPTAILDETYFYLEEYDQYFELKYPEKSQFVSQQQFDSFWAQLKAYVKEMMQAFENPDVEANKEKIQNEVNLNSLVDYLIIDQIMGEQDHAWKSFNMYYTNTSSDQENGKLNFGPIWDYDWCLYTPWTGSPNEDYTVSDEIAYSNIFFTAVADVPEFYEMVKERYTLYASPALEAYLEQFDEIASSVTESVAINAAKWYTSFDPDLSQDNIDFLKEYLENRKAVLDDAWLVATD